MHETFFVVQSPSELADLREEWNELLGRAPGYYLSQTFNWAAVAWEHVAQPRGRKLFCVGIRDGSRLVALWPMVAYREGLSKAVRPLGTEGSEYSSPLVEQGADASRRTRKLLAFIATRADLIVLPFVRDDSGLSKVIRDVGLLRAAEYGGPAPFIQRSAFGDWEGYQRSRTAFLRSKIKRMHKRLASHGTVTLGEEDSRNARDVIAWVIAQKERVLIRDRVTDAWLLQSEYLDFWAAIAAKDAAVKIMTLKLDGTLVAAQVCAVDGRRLEGFLSGFDKKWAHCSPGYLVIDYAARWAFERGLDLDTRIGDEPYKRDWTDHSCDTFTWHIATSVRAVPQVLRHLLRNWQLQMRTKLSRWRRRLKARFSNLTFA